MRLRPAVLTLLLCLLAPVYALAVLISTGDGSGNTTAPPDDPGFANVGVSANNLSGVYLGNKWVLTAAHVGDVADFTFDGILYETVPGTRQALSKNGTPADLAMIRLAGPPPPLPDVVLASAPVAAGEVVTLIGNGWNRAPTLTCWNLSWSEVNCPGGVYAGYVRSGGRSLRWGMNRVTDVLYDLPGSGNRSTISFEMLFDEAGEPDEAQVVPGDSGGAAFVKRAGTWELVGIHLAQGVYVNQPTDVVAFGNGSLDGDVYEYRNEIEALLGLPKKIPALPGPALLLVGAVLLAAARRRLLAVRVSSGR
jgi:hypothetical protein